jgi:hypothetical protein
MFFIQAVLKANKTLHHTQVSYVTTSISNVASVSIQSKLLGPGQLYMEKHFITLPTAVV